jgi:L-ribulose-5-phosphate 4-epimerase
MHEQLKERVCKANLELVEHKLIVFTWGNVSEIDRQAGVMAIKPSGVDYDELTADKIVVLNMDGNIIDGNFRPSSDTPTHLELYRNFEGIGGICHNHSCYTTMWAQACKEIPCLGTTHADHFNGPVPVTQIMKPQEIKNDYELNTGRDLVRRFEDIDPMQIPAVLVANHGPFTWGSDGHDAVKNAVVLEHVAQMALGTLQINPQQDEIPQPLLDKHYLRKHGENAYYGQT